MKTRHKLVVAVVMTMASTAHGHGDDQGKAKRRAEVPEQTAFGQSAGVRAASRTVSIAMSDRMRFSPDSLAIKRGETVRFVVANEGRTMHEMVLGTMAELKQHAALMRKYPGMEHDEPYMTHVPPGKTRAIVWQFTKPGEFYYGCLIPGHFEAGMIGKITVR